MFRRRVRRIACRMHARSAAMHPGRPAATCWPPAPAAAPALQPRGAAGDRARAVPRDPAGRCAGVRARRRWRPLARLLASSSVLSRRTSGPARWPFLTRLPHLPTIHPLRSGGHQRAGAGRGRGLPGLHPAPRLPRLGGLPLAAGARAGGGGAACWRAGPGVRVLATGALCGSRTPRGCLKRLCACVEPAPQNTRFRSQAGRAGRREQPSLGIYLGWDGPLDQVGGRSAGRRVIA